MKVVIPGTFQCIAVLALAAQFAKEAEASRSYVSKLPNGAIVPGAAAIGHTDGTGSSSATNSFGDAFADADYTWTKTLCMADSDGDGQTNGQELGDPCCEWVKTTNPVLRWTTGVSNPGDATKKADPSLWANVQCGSTSSPTTAPTTSTPVTTTPPTTATPTATTRPPVTTTPPTTTSPPTTTIPPATTRPPATTTPPTTRPPTTTSPPATTIPPATTRPPATTTPPTTRPPATTSSPATTSPAPCTGKPGAKPTLRGGPNSIKAARTDHQHKAKQYFKPTHHHQPSNNEKQGKAEYP
ncbi:unnamed protein product [Phytophthora lilii]|uniref:Unnamed protein product n=1 Tax=Phytophthora lilii TaxID=2077276 RepID=A0A9W6WRQ7_9STRA|nr:unnamed protein product [Phytophthora lilii]